ncbi:MAG: hypothetical protein PHH77_08215 [Victivallaceae bacterium]|nr:hypothetical protein [Victivallaceae bacterium]
MQEQQSEPTAREIYPPVILWAAVAVAITMLVFIPALHYRFLTEWGDGYYTGDPRLEFTLANLRCWLTGSVERLYTPLTSYSLMLDHALFGNHPAGYHLHNLLLHCGALLLFLAILRRLRVAPLIAAGTALLWAVHPQRVPSVVWITERKDVLAVFFALAAFYTYMEACRCRRFALLPPLLLLLSLGAKPAAVGLPAVMLIYTWLRHRKWRELTLVIPSLAVTVLFLGWFCFLQKMPSPLAEQITFPQRIWIIAHNVMWYWCSSFVPFQLNPIYPPVSLPGREYLPLACGFTLLAGIAGTALFRNGTALKRKWLAAGAAVFCWGALFFPVSGIITIGTVDYGDRYNYLPTTVSWALLALFVSRRNREKKLNGRLRKYAPLAFLPVLYCYWYLTWSYLPVWSDSKNLFVRAVQWQYPNFRAIDNLGTVAINRNDPQLLDLAAAKFLTLAAAAAGGRLRWYPSRIHRAAWLNAGLFLGAYSRFRRGDVKTAFPVFVRLQRLAETKGLKFFGRDGYIQKFWGSLAACYLEFKHPEAALKCLKIQLPLLEPDSSEACFNLGLTAFLNSDFSAAEKYWRAAAQAGNPNDPNINYNLELLRKLQNRERSPKKRVK